VSEISVREAGVRGVPPSGGWGREGMRRRYECCGRRGGGVMGGGCGRGEGNGSGGRGGFWEACRREGREWQRTGGGQGAGVGGWGVVGSKLRGEGWAINTPPFKKAGERERSPLGGDPRLRGRKGKSLAGCEGVSERDRGEGESLLEGGSIVGGG